ncbi:MAG: hypothetical protein ICV66_04420 [Chitinophagaceae bacterium]|nr:hypothetical protein [Chitinophagaceae bacterium]
MKSQQSEKSSDKKTDENTDETKTKGTEKGAQSHEETDVKNASAAGVGAIGRNDENLSSDSEKDSDKTSPNVERY